MNNCNTSPLFIPTTVLVQIKNLDAVDVAATNVSCDNLTVKGENITNVLQNVTNPAAGSTSFTGLLSADNILASNTTTTASLVSGTTSAGTLSATSINDTGSLTVGGASSVQALTATSLTSSGDLTVDTNVLKVDTVLNRVGIMNAAPTEALDVTGNAKVSGNLTVDTTTLVVAASSNRVGVNTATPLQTLHVDGTALINNNTTASTSMVGLSVLTPNATAVTNQVEMLVGKDTGALGNARLTYRSGGTSTTTYGALGIAGTNPPIIFQPSNVMIGNTGSTTPTFSTAYALEVKGATKVTGTLDVTGGIGTDANLSCSGNIQAIGNATIGGTLTVGGKAITTASSGQNSALSGTVNTLGITLGSNYTRIALMGVTAGAAHNIWLSIPVACSGETYTTNGASTEAWAANTAYIKNATLSIPTGSKAYGWIDIERIDSTTSMVTSYVIWGSSSNYTATMCGLITAATNTVSLRCSSNFSAGGRVCTSYF